MKRSILFGSLGLAVVLLVSGRPTRPSAGEDGGGRSAERDVRELEDQLVRAAIRGDRAFFERILADDFTHTSHSGVFKTRAQWLAEDKAGDREAAGARYEAIEVDDLAVRIYGDAAVVTGRTTPRGRNAKGEPITGQYRFLRVWARRQGQWQAVAFEGTRIART